MINRIKSVPLIGLPIFIVPTRIYLLFIYLSYCSSTNLIRSLGRRSDLWY